VPTITYVEFDGTQHVIEGDPGSTVMRTAIDNGVPGIDAACGGEGSCATCHVIVSDTRICVVGLTGHLTESMLDLNPERSANSRLSCQIEVNETIDGLVVELPEFQM